MKIWTYKYLFWRKFCVHECTHCVISIDKCLHELDNHQGMKALRASCANTKLLVNKRKVYCDMKISYEDDIRQHTKKFCFHVDSSAANEHRLCVFSSLNGNFWRAAVDNFNNKVMIIHYLVYTCLDSWTWVLTRMSIMDCIIGTQYFKDRGTIVRSRLRKGYLIHNLCVFPNASSLSLPAMPKIYKFLLVNTFFFVRFVGKIVFGLSSSFVLIKIPSTYESFRRMLLCNLPAGRYRSCATEIILIRKMWFRCICYFEIS